MKTRKNVLVLCTGNSCRSQMAHGYLAHFADPALVDIYSAGIESHGVNPLAISTMLEDGIDISAYTSNLIDDYAHIRFDYVITVCDHASQKCPIFPTTAIRLHHNFPDPAKFIGSAAEVNEHFRTVRQLIRRFCENFLAVHFGNAEPT